MRHYQTLGIDNSATPEEIKKAYRKLANIHHPDKGGDIKKFQEIQTAYDTLSDPNKKAKYDMGVESNNSQGSNPFDFFNFSNMFDWSRTQIFTITLIVTLDQVAKGGMESIRINTPGGSKIAQIEIPKGIEDGQQVRYQNIIPDAMLHVIFRIKPNSKFERIGLDLQSKYTVDFFKLILGTKIKINDIFSNEIELTVPPMTKPGTRLRVAGKGLSNGQHVGDQYVLINGTLPDKISDQLKQLIEKEISKD